MLDLDAIRERNEERKRMHALKKENDRHEQPAPMNREYGDGTAFCCHCELQLCEPCQFKLADAAAPADVDALLAALPQWIRVDERPPLPDDGDELFLVLLDPPRLNVNGESVVGYDLGRFVAGRWFISSLGDGPPPPDAPAVTHYMALPEPPTEPRS